jgi:outer membrane protein
VFAFGRRLCWPAHLLALFALLPVAVSAQQAPATLTLDDALRLARANNPDYLARTTESINADWAVRAAYAALLPGASATTTLQYQGEGTPRVGTLTGGDFGVDRTPSYYMSNYSLGLNYQIAGSTLLTPRQELANRRAVEAGIVAASFSLDAQVKRQYLAVLRAQDGVELARQELERTEDVRRLAEANVAVGRAIPLEVMQAEVQVGRAEVALLQAENLVETERLRLIQTLGIDVDREIVLTSDFPVEPISWTQESLVEMALAAHPQLRAARATEEASVSGVRIARTAYLPTIDIGAGWSGYTRQAANSDFLVQQARNAAANQQQQCVLLNQISAGLSQPLPNTPADCSLFAFTPQDESRVRSSNNMFPFNFTREPVGMQLRVSLPIFQGLTRERNIEAAKVAAQDARYRVRGEELRLRTEVATAFLDARTAERAVALEERNRQLADEQLRLARERYRLGASSFLDLQEAETAKARADREHLNAIYAYHEALAGLEAAVGRPLREIR